MPKPGGRLPASRLPTQLLRFSREGLEILFGEDESFHQIACSILSEQHEEWQVAKRYFSAGSLAKLERTEEVAEQPQLMAG